MDILTLLLLMIVVVLVVIVVRLRRVGTCKCECPVDEEWLDNFNKWATAQDKWADDVQDWIKAFNTCLNEKCYPNAEGAQPPDPPPCKFGSC